MWLKLENKIGFFKKVWYSITNIKKYDEINEGLQAMINVLKELLEESEENWKWA